MVMTALQDLLYLSHLSVYKQSKYNVLIGEL